MCFHETGCSVWIETAHEGWLIPIPSFSWRLNSKYILIEFDSAANSNAECSCGSAFQQCPPTSPSLCGMFWVPADVRAVLSCSLIKHRAGHVARSLAGISGLFLFLCPLKSPFWNALLLWYRRRLFCESPFSQVAWQLFSKAVKGSLSRGVCMSNRELLCCFCLCSMCYSGVSTTPSSSALLHFRLCAISANTLLHWL